MTAAADITIKKADGTTDIVWTLIAASGGDKSPAVWRSNTATGTPGQKPEIRVSASGNSGFTGRKISVELTFPQVYTDTNTSLTQVRTRANVKVEAFVPSDMDATTAGEYGAQFGHLMAHTLLVGSFSSGFAPT